MGVDPVGLARLAEVASHTQQVQRTGDAAVTDLHADTRAVTPGSVFVAVRGSTADGHDLAGAGVTRRVIAEAFWRAARFHERLGDTVRRPGLGASGLEHERRLQGDRGNP